MRVIVNAIPLLNIPTGIGRYIRELYTEIRRCHPEIHIQFFDGSRLLDAMPTSPGDKGIWSSLVSFAWQIPPIIPYLARVLIHEKRAMLFTKLSRGFDIYHEPGFFPFKAHDSVRTIFTIHDLSLLALPEYHPRERVLFFQRYFEHSLKHTDLIITPSIFTKNEIQHYYPDTGIGIYPVHLGYNRSLFFRQSDSIVARMKNKLDLPDKYVLFVGTSDPRKNIGLIVRMMESLPSSISFVCVGWSGWENKTDYSSSMLNNRRIKYTGYVSDKMLATLYSGARVFVYPSFYEGFGLPVLEAMACGCPVVCSNRASLPEVAGSTGAAVICSPYDYKSFDMAVFSIFKSNALYDRMSSQGVVQAEKFSWQSTAARTIELFANVHNGA